MGSITCSITGVTKETKDGKNGPRLPRGWKRFSGRVYSAEAWREAFVLRTFYFPVLKPAEGSWKELSDKLHEAWGRSTSTLQWAYKELLKNDISRTPELSKIPKMPSIYLYGMRDWHGWAASANCLLRLAEQTYRERRYDIVWRGNASLPNSTYPQPFLVHEASWSMEKTEAGELIVSLPLVDCRVSIVLKTHSHKRALAVAERVIAGELKATEAKIYRGKKGDVMFAFGAWVPKQHQDKQPSGALRVRHDSDCFLVALNTKDEKLWVVNGDRARRWVVQRDRALNRFRDDLKFERRPMSRAEKQKSQRCAQKQRDRLRSFMQETAAQLVGYAVRRGFAEIQYDDSEKSFLSRGPWGEFASCLRNKCEQQGVVLNTVAARKTTNGSK